MSDNQPASLVIHASVIDCKDAGTDCARLRALAAIGGVSVAISRMRELPTTLFTGKLFDKNTAPIVVAHSQHQAAVRCNRSLNEYTRNAGSLARKIAVANATSAKVRFAFSHHEQGAADKYPNGLPKPHFQDPAHWLVTGNPIVATISTIPERRNMQRRAGSQIKGANVGRMAISAIRRDKRHMECAERGDV